jgi:acyl-coenzyme A thioesterase PaaI-like protein
MPPEDGAAGAASEGARLHWRALEGLYTSAPVNHLFSSRLEIVGEGRSRIVFDVDPSCFHAAGGAHGTIYFKMLDDAAFYAANTLVTDRFLLTTSFNLFFSRPIHGGRVIAEGRWVSGRRRVLVADRGWWTRKARKWAGAPARFSGRASRWAAWKAIMPACAARPPERIGRRSWQRAFRPSRSQRTDPPRAGAGRLRDGAAQGRAGLRHHPDCYGG